MDDAELHTIAREASAELVDPDRKQMRFNEIISVAKSHYYGNPAAGVVEIVQSCDRECPELYVKNAPMWATLRDHYAWMERANG